MTSSNMSVSNTKSSKDSQKICNAIEKDVVWNGRDVGQLDVDSSNKNVVSLIHSLFSSSSRTLSNLEKDIEFLEIPLPERLKTIIRDYINHIDYVVDIVKEEKEIPDFLKIHIKDQKHLDLTKYTLTGPQVLKVLLCFDDLLSLKITEFCSIDELSTISNNQLTKSLQKLEHLDISKMKEIKTSIYYLFNITTQLKHLNVSYTDLDDIYDHDLKNISQLQELEYLDISGCEISDSGLAVIHKLKKLRILNAYETLVTDKGEKDICEKIPGLIVNYGYDISTLDVLLPPLKSIIGSYLDPVEYMVEKLIEEQDLPSYLKLHAKNVKHLDLSSYKLTTPQLYKLLLCFKDLKSFKTTSPFTFSELDTFATVYGRLKSLQKLEHLDISKMSRGVTAILQAFALLSTSLKHLNISDSGKNELLYPSFDSFRSFKELEHLDISGCYVDGGRLNIIHELKNLKKLYALRTNITKAHVEEMNKKIPNLTVYYDTDVSSNSSTGTKLVSMHRFFKYLDIEF